MTDAEKDIAAMRAKIESIWDTMDAADFKRLHTKFLDILVTLEVGFERRYPEEFRIWREEFYGDE